MNAVVEFVAKHSISAKEIAPYECNPEDALHIHPAGVWRQRIVDYFNLPDEQRGDMLPWSKTHANVRLREGELSIWAGANGSGKSMLLSHVLLDLIAGGRRAVIASLEMSPVATLARMVRQACAVDLPTPREVDCALYALGTKLWLYDQIGTVHAKRVFGVIRYAREELGADHVVIDSLMKCGISTEDLDQQKRFIDRLSTYTKDTGVHLHLVAHTTKASGGDAHADKYSVKGASEITDMADNVFVVWRNKAKEHKTQAASAQGDLLPPAERAAPDCTVTVDKQRHGEWEGRIALWFNPRSLQYSGKDTTDTFRYLVEE
ncbi:MAG: AAA family ATPase [Gammaproteobacteria bacterium]|nr:AAA family ATPase [Gammaproteobacteria bacterium]